MPSNERTRHAALTQREPIWPERDEHGDQRWTAAAQAERHLERMDPKRRAMLEAEWEQAR